MEYLSNEIRVASTDDAVNQILASAKTAGAANVEHTMHYTQGEDLFVRIPSTVRFPRFPIHHDIRKDRPSEQYSSSLREVTRQLVEAFPAHFQDLTYFFDPAETLKPCFYKIYKIEDDMYLYLFRIDLLFRPSECELVSQGTNDVTSEYRTDKVFFESELIPLDSIVWEAGKVRAFRIRQLISQTWIGETGRGYLLRGIWMDTDLSRFFSKLFIPSGIRIYPYFPFKCKYKTICEEAPLLRSDTRKVMVPLLHNALKFLMPSIEEIQSALKHVSFDEDMAEFKALKARVPESWLSFYSGLRVEAYLNEFDNKEYRLVFSDRQ